MANIDDVARAAGVSKSTVSNVFSKKRPISKDVADRVLQAAHKLSYKPNYWAKSLAGGKTRIIGINMEGEQIKFGAFHMALLNGVLKECYSRGYRLLVNTLPKDFTSQPENWSSDPIDGEIVLDPTVHDARLQGRLREQLPVVVIGRPPATFETRISYVDNDNEDAAFQVADYLLDLGHRRILFLNAPADRTVAQDREAGYRRAFASRKIPAAGELLAYRPSGSKSSVDVGYRLTMDYMSRYPDITAIITDTDKVAVGVYQAADELGLSIPDRLSVFSFSVEPGYGAEFSPSLSCVRLDAEHLGTEAARLLLESCEQPSPAVKRVMISSELLIRESCSRVKPQEDSERQYEHGPI